MNGTFFVFTFLFSQNSQKKLWHSPDAFTIEAMIVNYIKNTNWKIQYPSQQPTTEDPTSPFAT